MDELDIPSILTFTTKRSDFKGLPFLVNYAHLPPYCIVDKHKSGKDKVSGAFLDLLTIVFQHLNVTLVLQKPNEENKDIWHHRYIDYININVIMANISEPLSVSTSY